MHPLEAALHAHGGAAPIVLDPLRSVALHEGWMRLKGVAARRGEVQRPADLAAARLVMADVASGELLELLAEECLSWSARRQGG